MAVALNLVPFGGIAFLWFTGVVRDRIGPREDRCPTSLSLGWYDPAFVSKFITMHGLGNVVLTAADFGASKRPNDFLYKLHAFPVTLTVRPAR